MDSRTIPTKFTVVSSDTKISAFESESRPGVIFTSFCIWTFVIICRPQDIFPALGTMRPALLTGIITLLITFFRQREMGDRALFNQPQIKLFTALLFIMILGIPFSFYPRLSFMIIFTQYISVILYFYLSFKIIDSIKKAYSILFLGCLGNGLYMLASVTMGSLIQGRLHFGDMFDPNDMGFFALSFLPLNLIFVSQDNPLWKRLLCITFFGVNILSILLTGSRGGVVSLGAIMLMLLFTKTQTINVSIKTLSIIICILFVSFTPINFSRYKTLDSLQSDYNTWDETGRINIWKIGMKAMFANPLTGVGVGCFDEAVGRDRLRRGLQTARWQTAHNMVVQIGTETGIFGFCLFIMMSFNAFRAFGRTKKGTYPLKLTKVGEMGRVGFLGLFISGMFLSQAYSFYWAFYIVLSAIFSQFLGDYEVSERQSILKSNNK
jgi:O-antigen ligase